MKVKLQDNYKAFYTLEDVDRAKQIIKAEKDDEETAKGWAEYAIREALKDTYTVCTEVIKAEAHTAKNCRIWDAYGEETGDMDIIIEFTARTTEGFIEGSAYLSDIWQSGAVDYRNNMFYQIFRLA